jgi:hypothetical protein
MTQETYESALAQTEELLNHYGFELRGFSAQELISNWSKKYHPLWVRLAVVESLYQGRYKAVSVEQILNFWLRKGAPNFHFNHEFERLICRKLPRYFASFTYYSYPSQENKEKLYLPTSLVKKVDDVASENEAEIIPPNISILEAVNQEFNQQKEQLTLVGKKFNPSPIHQFKPSSDDSHLYVKLKEVAFNN